MDWSERQFTFQPRVEFTCFIDFQLVPYNSVTSNEGQYKIVVLPALSSPTIKIRISDVNRSLASDTFIAQTELQEPFGNFIAHSSN